MKKPFFNWPDSEKYEHLKYLHNFIYLFFNVNEPKFYNIL